MISYVNFPNVQNNINKLKPFLSKYKFEDLVCAIYCINIDRNNRIRLESSLSLNGSLFEISKFGTQPIQTYNEIISFFRTIKKILKPSSKDDEVCEDFGEVKIRVFEKTYKIFIGTGHNLVYSCMYTFEALSEITNNKLTLESVLEYQSSIINYFEDVNKSDGRSGSRYNCPSEELFQKTREFFQCEIHKQNLNFLDNLLDSEIIEKKHFIVKDSTTYPLFNTSILVDLYDSWHKNLEKKNKIKVANQSILSLIYSIARLEKKSPTLLSRICLVKEKSLKSNRIYMLGGFGKTGAILFLNTDEYNADGLNKEIGKIRKLHQKNLLTVSEVIPRDNSDELFGYHIKKEQNLFFVLYDSNTNISEGKIEFPMENNDSKNILQVSALDVINFLLFMDNIEELIEYINSQNDKNTPAIPTIGGETQKFFFWKSNNHSFNTGAIAYAAICLEVNIDNQYVFNYFNGSSKNFPWNQNDFLLSNPFSWSITEYEDDFFEYIYKLPNVKLRLLLKKFENNLFFAFVNNLYFFVSSNVLEKYVGIVPLVDDLNIRKVNDCEKIFSQSTELKNYIIQFMFIPKEYVVQMNGKKIPFDKYKKYVFSDLRIDANKIMLRYTINTVKLFKDIEKVTDRTVENKYFIELFDPLKSNSPTVYSDIVNKLESEKNNKKEVSLKTFDIDYIWEENPNYFKVEDKFYVSVRKKIAKKCMSLDIVPGTYFGEVANTTIRKIQTSLIEDFEKNIIEYNRIDLHNKLCSIYCSSSFIISAHKKRLNSFDNLDPNIYKEIRKKVIKEIEEEKHNLRTLQYLIESNLFISRETLNIIDSEELQYLLAFSNWLVVLSENADICHFTQEETHIIVETDYKVNIENNDNKCFDVEKVKNQFYDYPNYTISYNEMDKKFFEEVLKNFYIDTKIDFETLMDICAFFQTGFKEYSHERVLANVIRMNKKEVLNFIHDELNKEITLSEIKKGVEFLTIDPSKIKEKNGEIVSYIPFGERENRDNRFDIKPIFDEGEHLYFSPGIVSSVASRWMNGTSDFYLPYEIGLKNVKKTLNNWKKAYEDKIVIDTEIILKQNGFDFTRKEAKLFKIDRQHAHPRDLGDYDVFAVNTNLKEICIIECKFLKKAGSFFEMYKQQKNFFITKKYDEKFQRRIDYINDHYKEILETLKIDTSVDYKIIPIMVMNKVLVSRYKKVDFPIVSYGKLKEYLEKQRE